MDIKSLHHVAYRCKDAKQTAEYKAKLEKLGIEVVGPTDHTVCKSIYFFDPNGHRLELTVDTTTPEMKKKLQKLDIALQVAQRAYVLIKGRIVLSDTTISSPASARPTA